ncbi:trans-sulfuration enzyme family protein [Brevibacterium spongiae]|uniref:PLP-dependent aspartate aminotransferase family protein n=1 Tax=Brevibacterium spongiae TaxID=2909672 RepID=A0ABY5SLK7_9MICO|nr:PLP-dependent aspartate aminotransferase family protein [Brevibacterium spongiae]UVI35408.1 PLP-dependent aspartate aminotransferase family protein [Brevibacterium spongiae]
MTSPEPDSSARPALSPDTLVVEIGRPPRTDGASVNPPIDLSSTFVSTGDISSSPYAYARFDTPAWSPFEEALGQLEHASLPGLVFGSGLAAISAVISLVPASGTLVIPAHTYQGALASAEQIAQRQGFDLVTVDIADTEAVIAALDEASAKTAGPGMLWIESPTNPMLEVGDVPALTAAAKDRGFLVAVDNTFATPLLQTPLDHGADIVVHSVTKYLAGHSDVVLGAALTSSTELRERLHTERSMRGAIAGPFEVWLALRGLRTLAVRLDRAQANAQAIAERLAAHPTVTETRYPGLPADPGHARAAAQMNGFGAIIAFTVDTAEKATAIAEAVRLWTPATSLGGVESLIERRRRHPAEPETVPEGLIRLSVGIENLEDLWADLEAALG